MPSNEFNKAKQHRPFGAGPRYARPLLAALAAKGAILFVAMFLILLITALYHAMQFHSYLTKASHVWAGNIDTLVMGFTYRSAVKMYKDMSFVGAIFEGKGLMLVSDIELRKNFLMAKHYLRAQIYCGLAAFAVVVLDGVLNT